MHDAHHCDRLFEVMETSKPSGGTSCDTLDKLYNHTLDPSPLFHRSCQRLYAPISLIGEQGGGEESEVWGYLEPVCRMFGDALRLTKQSRRLVPDPILTSTRRQHGCKDNEEHANFDTRCALNRSRNGYLIGKHSECGEQFYRSI